MNLKKILILGLGVGFSLTSIAEESSTVNASQAKIHLNAMIEQLSQGADKETQGYLEELKSATGVILDNTKAPIAAIGFMAGVDAGIQVKTFKAGSKNIVIGPGGQAVYGPLFSFYKDANNKTAITVSGSSLAGVNLTAKASKKLVDFGAQAQFGVVIVYAHKNKDGTPKLKRVIDTSGWYYGFAGEGAIPVFLLNRIRLNVGIYSLVNSDRLMSESGKNPATIISEESKKALDAWKTKPTAEAASQSFQGLKTMGSDSLSSAGQSLNSFLQNVIIGDATMVVINGQIGTKDAPLELQAEALRLKVTQ